MAMKPGTKIVAPFLRATSSTTGTVHAVENTASMRKAGDGTALTVCGRRTAGADIPVKRFQSGIDGLCERCYARVVQARIDRLVEKKNRYNAMAAQRIRDSRQREREMEMGVVEEKIVEGSR